MRQRPGHHNCCLSINACWSSCRRLERESGGMISSSSHLLPYRLSILRLFVKNASHARHHRPHGAVAVLLLAAGEGDV